MGGHPLILAYLRKIKGNAKVAQKGKRENPYQRNSSILPLPSRYLQLQPNLLGIYHVAWRRIRRDLRAEALLSFGSIFWCIRISRLSTKHSVSTDNAPLNTYS